MRRGCDDGRDPVAAECGIEGDNVNIRHAVAAALAGLTPFIASLAHAQSAAPAPASNELGEVVVTGTSIRGVTPTASQSVTLGREDLALTGAATASDLARTLPQVLSLGADESRLGGAQDGAANTTRISGINLRGIGNEATLLLVNGRRIAPAGVIKSLYDPNVIPAGAVERLEVVVDGASAIYGSDAVAGVVNIITRKDYRGAETTLRYGGASGVDQKVFGQTGGYTWDGGSVFAAFEHYDRGALAGRDRDFATWDRRARGGTDARSTLASPGNIVNGTTRFPLPAGAGTGLTPAQLTAGTANRFDDGAFADLVPSQKRDTAFLDARHDFGAVEIWYQGFFTDRDFEERVAPASGQLRVPNTNAFFVAPAALGAATFVNVEYRFLAEDANPRLVGTERAYQNAAGFGWELGADWNLDGYASLSRNHGFQSRGAITNGAALTAALASNNPAVAFNPFGDGSSNVSRIPSTVDIIVASRDTTGWSTNKDYALKADGPLFALPGGQVRLAIGAERHEQEFKQRLIATNVLASGAATVKNIVNDRSFNSLFAEVYVPLVGAANGVAGVRRLDLSLAGRREDYSDFGTTTTPKVGLTWAPLDALTVRATYGKSFRAPSLVDSSAQIHNIFIQNLTDPTSTTGVTRGIFHNGGRTGLEPERAKTYSFGVDWKPEGALQGLTASATWYRVNYQNRIDVVPNTALTNAAVWGPFIVRRPAATDVAGNAAFNTLVTSFLTDPDLQNPVEPVTNINAIVDGRRANLGTLKQTGLDLNLAYAFDTAAGDFRLGLDWAKIRDLTRQTAPGLAFANVLDTFGNPISDRGRLSVLWHRGGWQASAFYNYVGDYRNTAITPNVSIDSYKTLDATVGYEFGEGFGSVLKNLRLTLSVNDLLDEEPPVVLNGNVSWDNQVVSPLGRQTSLTVSKRW